MAWIAAGGVAAATAAAQHTSSYRVKFKRKEFLELVKIAQPKIIYHRKRMPLLRLRRLRNVHL